jgi:hypothetical protein
VDLSSDEKDEEEEDKEDQTMREITLSKHEDSIPLEPRQKRLKRDDDSFQPTICKRSQRKRYNSQVAPPSKEISPDGSKPIRCKECGQTFPHG